MNLDAIIATFQASIDTKQALINDTKRLEGLLEVANVASSTIKALIVDDATLATSRSPSKRFVSLMRACLVSMLA